MKRLPIFFCLFLFLLLTGCAGKITHGTIESQLYVSNMANFTLQIPNGWHATIADPIGNTEQRIRKTTSRDRELGYLIKDDSSSTIIIEVFPYTWGGKKVLPAYVFWNRLGPTRSKSICEMKSDYEKQKCPLSAFCSYTCKTIPLITWCSKSFRCFEREKEVFYHDGRRSIKRDYIIGPEKKDVEGSVFDSGLHGWRVWLTLASPKEHLDENMLIFKRLIFTMKEYNN